MNKVLVDINNVSKTFDRHRVVNDISFSLSKGQITALLGVNGAGKSTIMNMMVGIIPPDSGNILVGGADIEKDSLKAKRNIGFLPENNPLYEDMYVREYLEYVADIYMSSKLAKERVASVIEEVGLSEEFKKKIGNLSKGNKQRVGLAQALIHNPSVLILDEPMTGFDPQQQEEVKALLLRLKENTTILFSTHHLQEVMDIASRYLIVNKGNLVYDGADEEKISIELLSEKMTK